MSKVCSLVAAIALFTFAPATADAGPATKQTAEKPASSSPAKTRAKSAKSTAKPKKKKRAIRKRRLRTKQARVKQARASSGATLTPKASSDLPTKGEDRAQTTATPTASQSELQRMSRLIEKSVKARHPKATGRIVVRFRISKLGAPRDVFVVGFDDKLDRKLESELASLKFRELSGRHIHTRLVFQGGKLIRQ